MYVFLFKEKTKNIKESTHFLSSNWKIEYIIQNKELLT